MTLTDHIVLTAYVSLLGVLSLFALHRLSLAWAARRFTAPQDTRVDHWPTVLVQVPLYNERYVAERVIDAVCRLDYPKGRLTLQVLDDSTDGTSKIVAERVRLWSRRGISIVHVRRGNRRGYKAGALAAGLEVSSAELVAIFDADFVPAPDFLQKLVPSFQDPDVGMVQARWDYLNREQSPLTWAQAILLDAHFINEHGGRFVLGHFFNFNGTCGIWRRRCIDDAGGWSGATLTEDMDLSYRAQLRGWRFVYRQDVGVPGELPTSANAFKTQQHRWAKGSLEVARKLLRTLWSARHVPLRVRMEGTVHLCGNLAFPLVLLLALIMPWAISARVLRVSPLAYLLDGGLLLGSTGSLVLSFLLAERRLGLGKRAIVHLPLVLALGIGLAINNTRAVIEALVGRRSAFVRTPKLAGRSAAAVGASYNGSGDWQAGLETAFGVYMVFALVVAASAGRILALPFLALFATGFLTLGLGSLGRRSQKVDKSLTAPAYPKRI